ncbi:hypothetical protein A0H81_00475 [Grifola frondosa]|uniref:Aminoglycoside phosphotransferase domain-containing protein n=1 Tax=Grifola frondosa TaxID=5627 RepID=A0A1C7MRM3_GRIFR|nr:hypothetical protein A0H81_00475 [Grifola frondosa]
MDATVRNTPRICEAPRLVTVVITLPKIASAVLGRVKRLIEHRSFVSTTAFTMATVALFAFGVKLLDKLRILSGALTASSIIESNTLDMTLAEIAMLSDHEIVALYESSPRLNIPNWIGFGFAKVPPFALITPSVLVKFGHIPAWEVRTMDLVRFHSTIPVPKVYRFFGRDMKGWWMSYLAMQYIPGRPLDECWNELSLWPSQDLHRADCAANPGPIADDPSQPEKCYNPVTGDNFVGPFATQAELADWMNGRLRASQAVMQYGYHCQPFDESEPLVLVHGDIQMRNLILGDDGSFG